MTEWKYKTYSWLRSSLLKLSNDVMNTRHPIPSPRTYFALKSIVLAFGKMLNVTSV